MRGSDTEAGVVRSCCLTRRPNGCREITKGTGQSTDPCGPLPATAEALDSSVEEEEPGQCTWVWCDEALWQDKVAE